MNKFFRALIAGYGAKKLGGGCLSTIVIFFIIYYALGNCNSRSAQTRHTNIHLQTHSNITISDSRSNENKKTVAYVYK